MTKDPFGWPAGNDETPALEKKPRKSELAEDVLDLQIEAMLVGEAIKVNEGNNGVIFKVAIPLETALAETLKLEGEGDSVDTAIKVMKLYQPGAGEKEFEMQGKVFDLCETSKKEGARVAEIPRPIIIRDIDLSEESATTLKTGGVLFSGTKAEVILMDYIEGVDLATYLYREVVKRHPKASHIHESVEDLSFTDLQIEAALALGYAAPGGKSHRAEEKLFEAEVVANQNAQLLVKYLEKNDFVLDPRVVEIIKNTLEVMHKNGIFHRDAHLRNFMIDPNSLDKEEDPIVYLIDFGTSVVAGPAERVDVSDIYLEGGKRFISDDYAENFLTPLTKSKEEKNKEKIKQRLGKALRLKKRLEKRPEWQNFWAKYEKNEGLSVSSIFEEIKGWSSVSNPDLQFTVFTLILAELDEEGRLDRAELKSFIEEELNKKPVPFVHNQLVQVAELF